MCSITFKVILFTVILFALFGVVYTVARNDDTDVFNKVAVISSLAISALIIYLVIGILNNLDCFNPLKELVEWYMT